MPNINFNSGAFVLLSAEFIAVDRVLVSFNYPPDSGLAGYALTVNGQPVVLGTQSPGPTVYQTILHVAAQPFNAPAVLTVDANITSSAVPAVPSSYNFTTITSVTPSQDPLVQGTQNDALVDTLRRFLPPLFRNKPGWEALLAAIAAGDQGVRDSVISAFSQLFLSSASGNYLIERAADQGVQYPETAGISEEVFRKLAILLSNERQIQQALLGVLEAFYGFDSTHARIESTLSGPFSFAVGDTLTIVVDDREEVTIEAKEEDYDSISAATPTEVAAVMTRAFRDAGSSAFAVAAIVDGVERVVVYSGSIGLLGSLKVTGGMMNLALGFGFLTGFNANGNWQRKLLSLDEFQLIWQEVGFPSGLEAVNPGDYVLIDSPVATELRSSYDVVDVYIDADPITGSFAGRCWFSVKPSTGFVYTTVGQPLTTFFALGDEFAFHRKARSTVANNANPAFIVQHEPLAGVEAILPVTTQSVARPYNAAAYLHLDSSAVDVVGPFVFDPDSYATTNTETTLNLTVAKGRGVSVLPVASTVGFPNEECWLVLAFAHKDEVGPVRCLGVLDSNNLLIDRSFVFPKTVPSGVTVTLLAGKGGFEPASSEKSFVLTDASAGRIAAEKFLDETKAAGITLTKKVVYPGDRGLGGQGDPITGPNLSDKVEIWASDDVDAAVEAAHNA